ncbi:hypothetical protein [Streptomyces sp.]|uniref:hypothetical protein n=1 Tax=Streptomyces sp. TaxID=1931 RepID=UPI002F408014
MGDTWNFGIECPEDWIPLPVRGDVNVRRWAKEQAKVLGGSRGLMHELREHAEDGRGREPILAFAYCPAPPEMDAVMAVLEVQAVRPDGEVPEPTLDWIVGTFSAPDFGEPEVERASLPAGPAVRIRQALADRRTGFGGPSTLVETVTYGVLPTGSEGAFLLLFSWATPGVADFIVPIADEIAHSFTVGDGT